MRRINKSQKGLYLMTRAMINNLICLVQNRMHRQRGIENLNDKNIYATFKSSPICFLESFFLCERLSNVGIKDTERVSFKSRKDMKKRIL